jgi:ubiquinone/menaquinone biosynthesis C-methylase UbiE
MPKAPIDPNSYSEEYFLKGCDGYEEYLGDEGVLLPPRLRTLWKFLHVHPNMRVLDVGCGRGEIVVHCSTEGAYAVGIDYSEVGLRLAQQTIKHHADHQDQEPEMKPDLSLSDAKRLPFASNSFNRAVMSDLVEHLYPEELKVALEEIHRVLMPGGYLLIHTMPNLWYYRYGYPLFRFVEQLRGVSLPADPRERFQFSHVHINEQTPRTLRQTLSSIGFSYWRVWLYDYRDYSQHGALMKNAMHLLTSLPVVKKIFCDDVFALARK